MGRIPQTQMDAWNDVRETADQARFKVWCAIFESETGRTLFELVKKMGWPVNRISGRVTELKAAGHIYDTGERRVNPESGKNGIVYKTKKPSEAVQRSLL